jgi:hypothetical protein
MVSDEREEEMICALTAEEHEALQRELKGLPDTMPPRAVWRRIREQAEAEGLIKRRAMQRPSTWYGGVGLAAAVALAAVMVPAVLNSPQPDSFTEPQTSDVTNSVQINALQALMVESRQLESDLRSLPDEPRVMQMSTVATLSDIEERIAAIDYQLNDPGVQMTPDEVHIFWRERVRLMKSLVHLRYAQAQRTAF